MAQDTYVAPGEIDLDDVIRAELEAINARRAAQATRPPPPGSAARASGGEEEPPRRPQLSLDIGYSDDRAVLEVTGLALSGGGIRSAAFSLGVLQALNQHDVFRHVDYLSTVSGGGYMGSSLTATMSATGGDFVFGRNSAASGAPPTSDISDTDAVAHIRNYSNYLIPTGIRDVLTAAAIIVRGLAANLGFLLPLLLLAAAVTVLANPSRSQLTTPVVADWRLFAWLGEGNFRITLLLSIVGLVLFFLWAFYRSFLRPGRLAEFRTVLPRIGAVYLVLVAVAAFSEFQPFVLAAMFQAADARTVAAVTGEAGEAATGGLIGAVAASWIQWLAAIAAPIWAAVTFFNQRVSKAIEAGTSGSRLRTRLAALVARASVWVAGAALPLLIWVGYLYLSYWGIDNDSPVDVAAIECPQQGVSGSFSLDIQAGDRTGGFAGTLAGDADDCPDTALEPIGPYDHTPGWMASIGNWLDERDVNAPERATGMFWSYLLAGLVLFVVAWWLRPNANSLHRLYRDRLSKAFLFDPDRRVAGPGAEEDRDLEPLDSFRLSDLSLIDAPYHLIGAALNVHGSDFANRRGRNADFFMFSHRYVGSIATGYAPTEMMETQAPDLDLATAFAVSGAAASSNMGSSSVRPLTPTLALLNVRLGYWLKNPYNVYRDPNPLPPRNPYFMWAEITGRLTETSEAVYLTDGGHIENLGVYELLRRKCRLIVAVDAEGDADMRFVSFISLQRYARIDLGIRISLPTDAIAEMTRAWMGAGSAARPESGVDPTQGPHIAVGRIDYGSGETGYLVYVKASLTGDENDYIRDYARRYSAYPHESTGDQFFSEEQFEVYRALGFHVMFGFLEGRDDVVAHVGLVAPPSVPAATPAAATAAATKAWTNAAIVRSDDAALAPVRTMLGLKTPAKP